MAKTKTTAAKGGKKKTERTKAKNKKDKPTAEALSDQEFKKRLYMYVGRYKPLVAAKEEAAADLKELIEEAKTNGIPKKDIELAIDLETAEGELAVGEDVKRIFRIARWAGTKIGTQLELFAKPSSKVDPIYDEGYRAGLQNQTAKPPSHHGENAAQRWLDGYHSGLKELNETRAERFGGTMAPLGNVAAKIAEEAGKNMDSPHREAA
jgi:hypothetical protein